MLSHILFTANEVITNNYTTSHTAIDVVGENRTISDVVSFEDGVVVLTVDNVKSNNTNTKGTATYGNFIKIKHNNGIQTLYAHLKYGSVRVKKGDTVKKGQVIATMGNTGRAFGVHLHFEVMDYNNIRKNPNDYLNNPSYVKSIESPTPTTTETKTEVTSETKIKDKQENTVDNELNINEDNTSNMEENTDEKTKENVEERKETPEDNTLSENIKEDFTLFENNEYKYLSLSDALDEIYVNNNYEYRSLLAQRNGISNYTGSKIQNLKLLQMLKSGTLKAVY